MLRSDLKETKTHFQGATDAINACPMSITQYHFHTRLLVGADSISHYSRCNRFLNSVSFAPSSLYLRNTFFQTDDERD